MSDEIPPGPSSNRAERAKQKRSLLLACGLLTLVGLAVLVLPLEKIPFPFRVMIAVGDIIAAAVLWLVARQSFSDKK